MKRIVPAVFILIAVFCVWLLLRPEPTDTGTLNVIPPIKVIAPISSPVWEKEKGSMENEQLAMDDLMDPKIALNEDEQMVSILTQDLYGDQMDEQLIALRDPNQPDSQVFLVLIEYDEYTNGYHRMDTVASGVYRPRSFSMFTRDLVGDRSVCVIINGMNAIGEQVMSVFRLRRSIQAGSGWIASTGDLQRILFLTNDGSIAIQEKERSQAYIQGYSRDDAFKISTYSRDTESTNILDQIETIYEWNEKSQRYERSATARIAGAQIEQKMLNEVLDGTAKKFEQFLAGMWTHSNQGGNTHKLAPDSLYFDPARYEIIFQRGGNQEIYTWNNAIPMRYGLYMTSRNMSIPTLRRLLNIELQSMDTIRVRVREDVRIKLGYGGQWDAIYQKSSLSESASSPEGSTDSIQLSGIYRSGSIQLELHDNKQYRYQEGSLILEGVYTRFVMGDDIIVEFRPALEAESKRGTYLLRKEKGKDGESILTLDQVSLGVKGMERLYEEALHFELIP